MRKYWWFIFSAVALSAMFIIGSCSVNEQPEPAADMVMDAALEGLTPEQQQLFDDGADQFDKIYTAETGLGPVFVETSCGACHPGDNRGKPENSITRFGQIDAAGNHFLHLNGPQIQNKAIAGFQPEQMPAGATFSHFVAPIAAGAGFLELVSDQDLLAMSDPDDINGDGISGVPNWNTLPEWLEPMPNAISQNGKYICRFGRKGSTYDLNQQTINAFNQDMGVSSKFLPTDPQNYQETKKQPAYKKPDISEEDIASTVFYLRVLQKPIQRNQNNEQVQNGKAVFMEIGCEACHKETLKTGYSPIAVLSNQTFHPYTDLLLHDMGPGLDDIYTEGSATTAEWRTAPLWGLGLAPDVQNGNYFLMHDGRAHSIEEAIMLHGGEGTASKENYAGLSIDDRNDLILFLQSL